MCVCVCVCGGGVMVNNVLTCELEGGGVSGACANWECEWGVRAWWLHTWPSILVLMAPVAAACSHAATFET